jgi:FKBP-type peptidyl-prolyl cis-trans isomerase FkpA
MSVTAVPIRPLAKGSVLKLWIALAVLLVAAVGLAWFSTAPYQVTTTPSGLRFRMIADGTGPTMTAADVIALRYKLHVTSPDSPVVQDSDEAGQPFVTTVPEVFPGFGEALQMMRAGGRYIIWLPPGLHVSGPLPPGAPFSAEDTLVFEIQALQIAPGAAAQRQMQQMQQLQQQMQQQQGAGPEGGAPGGPPSPPAGGPPGGR